MDLDDIGEAELKQRRNPADQGVNDQLADAMNTRGRHDLLFGV